MRIVTRRPGKRQSGMTLLETMVGVTIFAVLTYSLAVAVDVGNHSNRMVLNMASEDRALRAATRALVRELRGTMDASIVITALPDANHQVRFQMPIDNAGVADWGVFDRTLGTDAATQNRVDWSLRYTVRDVVDGNGNINKQLVRQILNAGLVVQRERVLVNGLRPGNPAPAGFRVVQQGGIWEVTLTTTGQDEGQAGIRTVFHVQTRN